MNNHLINSWAPVIFLWTVSALLTVILIGGQRKEDSFPEGKEDAVPSPAGYEIILTKETEETEEMPGSRLSEAQTEKESHRVETAGAPETEAVLFEPVTHAVPVEHSAPVPEREAGTEPVSKTVETGTVGRDAETTGSSTSWEEPSPEPVSQAFSGNKSESLICRYQTTRFPGEFRKESSEDRILIDFSRTASGEAIRFEVVTYEESLISAFSAGSPAESAEHAALLKERTGTAGSVYAYAVRELSGNMIYIDLFPDDRVAAVEDSGKTSVRFFTDTGYNGAVINNFFLN